MKNKIVKFTKEEMEHIMNYPLIDFRMGGENKGDFSNEFYETRKIEYGSKDFYILKSHLERFVKPVIKLKKKLNKRWVDMYAKICDKFTK